VPNGFGFQQFGGLPNLKNELSKKFYFMIIKRFIKNLPFGIK